MKAKHLSVMPSFGVDTLLDNRIRWLYHANWLPRCLKKDNPHDHVGSTSILVTFASELQTQHLKRQSARFAIAKLTRWDNGQNLSTEWERAESYNNIGPHELKRRAGLHEYESLVHQSCCRPPGGMTPAPFHHLVLVMYIFLPTRVWTREGSSNFYPIWMWTLVHLTQHR